MRVTGIVASGVAILVVVVLLGGELAATSLATRAARDAVEEYADVQQLEVTSLARPASLGVLQGEARDVRVTATGVRVGDLRIDRVDARIPVASVGFGAEPETLTVVGDARVLEEDLERYLVARAPDLAAPTFAVTEDGVEIGDERVPFTLGAAVRIDGDGNLVLLPTIGDPRLWSSLGLELELEVPRELELQALDLQNGAVVVSARAELPAEMVSEEGRAWR